jgi:hypothetical protein
LTSDPVYRDYRLTDQNVNRPFAKVSPALRTVGALSSTGYVEYNGLLLKFQRRSANHISFMNSYTFGRAIDLNSDNDGTVTLTDIFHPEYNRGPADYDVTHTFSSNWIYEMPWAAQHPWGGWQLSGIMYLRSGLPITITQSQGMLSTGLTNNRPNTICDPVSSSPTIAQWFNTSCFQQVPTPPARSGTRAATRFADRGSSTSTRRSSRTRRSGRWPRKSASTCSTC